MTARATDRWPASRTPELLELLARRMGASPGAAPSPSAHDSAEETLESRLRRGAARVGLDLEPVHVDRRQLRDALRSGPLLAQLPGSGDVMALVGGRARVRVLDVHGRIVRRPIEAVEQLLLPPAEVPENVERLIARLPFRPRSHARVRAALAAGRSGEPVGGLWLVGLPQSAPFLRQLSAAGLGRLLGGFVLAHAGELGLLVGAWYLLGRAALHGRFDDGWLVAWLLLLLMIPLTRALGELAQGRLAVRGGAVLKRRLLDSALSLEPDSVRRDGVGTHLGRVLESEAVETQSVQGGLSCAIAAMELLAALGVLSAGVGGYWHALLGGAWIALTIGWTRGYYRRLIGWAGARLSLSAELVERLVGHTTRLVQQAPDRWHDAEDLSLERYHEASRRLDRSAAVLIGAVPRGWLVVGLLGLAHPIVTGSAGSAAVAISLGGLLLGYLGLSRFAAGVLHLGRALAAWRLVRPLALADGPADATGPADRMLSAGAKQPLRLEAYNVVYRHAGRSEPILQGVQLRVRDGEHLLLQGPTGSGKSTLAAVLTGQARCDTGLVLLNGLDRQTLGAAAWRERTAYAPQYHQNHVVTAPFLFNLLMGRAWPPRSDDVREAVEVCRDLGLGELLERMPAGLLQQVGETGWQLSHGEQSRLFLARALLQDADLVVLDESFGALDPENLALALECSRKRASTLLVIAHP